uniref:DNA-directed RNA polymerase subunit beta' n=1 Tax=Euglena gracilis TaxID=3039 RepID=RPOC1_EUGGR|nr:RNA polymerase beta' subunit [Euglena gracilis]P23580.1 RecName: Full=DNA-directed RNA polymerase subunit beta'; AltName: Full=PEP; AltName: Full=Plastid-encoded RNA polymerase subunit beta'; Short=RNA polymerase subunit beta' [Euglena gracilis]CAA35053.1 RNA polymerase subunit [Euglena gracilis]CAA50137.1 RNA polymerase subunit [Euglena gracilis]
MKDYVRIKIASPQQVLSWTERSLPDGRLIGRLTNFDMLHFETKKPVFGGLLCERIFGSTKTNQCFCGKYKKMFQKGYANNFVLVCANCFVEINNCNRRRFRMGYIDLVFPLIHTWYLKSRPCYLAIMLGKKVKNIKKMCFMDSYIKIRNNDGQTVGILTGAEAIYSRLSKIDLESLIEFLYKRLVGIEKLKEYNFEKYLWLRKKFINRIKLVNAFIQTNTKPIWIMIHFLPVLPPDIRPVVKLQDGTVIMTDLNFLYIDIIYGNNKIIKLRKFLLPEEFMLNEKRSLQVKVDAFINNENISENPYEQNDKKLKSITEGLKGKKGRFRENLLGKTVDYSGRSVIVVEPKLLLHECGMPLDIALELFHPILIKMLIRFKFSVGIREAKRHIYNASNFVIPVLEKVLNSYFILLNRAPTLHRLGIQSFQPKVTFEKAILLHPLVCSAFNADFDGDQMGIHIPLSLKSLAEARSMLISINNCVLPANGLPSILPSQDMVLGCYYVTLENCNLDFILTNLKIYANIEKVKSAYHKGEILIQTFVWLICQKFPNILKNSKIRIKKKRMVKKLVFFRTTIGRIFFDDMIKEFL